MGMVKNKMMKVTEKVEKLADFNSGIFNEIRNLFGMDSEEFKMISEIDSKINYLSDLLNLDGGENDFNSEIASSEFNRYQNEIINSSEIEELNSEE